MAQISPYDRLVRMAHHVDGKLPGRLRWRLARTLWGRRDVRFIAPEIGNELALTADMSRRGLRHVILPVAADSDTCTVLVDDDDASRMLRYYTPWPIGRRLEVYSVGGLPGFAFGDMPLLPGLLAEKLLEGAQWGDGAMRPEPVDGFMFSLYREVYLRGRQSGLASELLPEPSGMENPALGKAIVAQAAALGLTVGQPVTLEALDKLLEGHGWRPPIEMLERIGCWNEWVLALLRRDGQWLGAEPAGPTVFYLRQRAITEGKRELVRDTLKAAGFMLPDVPLLSENQLVKVAGEVRGGNWGRGPFALSGGTPGEVFVGYDPHPVMPSEDMRERFPLLDNARIQQAKLAVRAAVHQGLPDSRRYNALHSTDNAVQAWRAIRELFPDVESRLRKEMQPASNTLH